MSPDLHAEAGNKAVTDKLEWARAQRAKGLPTIPSTIGVGLACFLYPFLAHITACTVSLPGRRGE